MIKRILLQLPVFLFPLFCFSQIGINTEDPQASLDVEGTLRISPLIIENIPESTLATGSPLYVNRSNGQTTLAPKGFSTISGGVRPGKVMTIAEFSPDNTLASVRFVFNVHRSNEANNSQKGAYVYGNFQVIGVGTANPARFVGVNIFNADGEAKDLILNTDTDISWYNGGLGTTTISIDQTTGALTVKSTQPVFSYFFDVLGGL